LTLIKKMKPLHSLPEAGRAGLKKSKTLAV
jgi:hypothetical protein